MEGVGQDPGESLEGFLEEPWLGVQVVEGLLVLVVELVAASKLNWKCVLYIHGAWLKSGI